MKLQTFTTAHECLSKVESFLLKNEAVNNLPLGILYSLTNAKSSYKPQIDPFFAAVEEEDIVLVMMITSPHRLIVCGEKTHPRLASALQLSVRHLTNKNVKVTSIIGIKDIASQFAEIWSRKSGCSCIVMMDQSIYRLRHVNPIKYSSGRFRVATQEDCSLIAQWMLAFSESLSERLKPEDAQRMSENAIRKSTIFLWDNNGPVSMANKTRPTKNGAVVNFVYTPPEYQRKGYATSCVASLSQHLLDSGYQFCTLYTDLSNPISNRIYMNIGYQPIEDSIVYQIADN